MALPRHGSFAAADIPPGGSGSVGTALKKAPPATQRSWLVLPTFKTTMRMFAGAIITVLTIGAMVYGEEPLGDLLHWLESHNNSRGMTGFVIIEAVTVALLLPAVPLIIAAGLVFGFARGVACVWAGASIGQIFAFLLARYILRDCMVNIMQKRFPSWDSLDKAIQMEGWKLILLLRMSPLVPYNVLNVLLGSSGISFRTFVVFSTVGIIPECMITVYFGTLAGSVANVINGRAGPQGPAKLAFIVLGGSMMLAAALYAGHVTKRAIRRAVVRANAEEDDLEAQELQTTQVITPSEVHMNAGPALRYDHGSNNSTSSGPSGGALSGSSDSPTQTGPAHQASQATFRSTLGGMPGVPAVAPACVQETEKTL